MVYIKVLKYCIELFIGDAVFQAKVKQDFNKEFTSFLSVQKARGIFVMRLHDVFYAFLQFGVYFSHLLLFHEVHYL